MQIGEDVARHFLAVFAEFPLLDVPDELHGVFGSVVKVMLTSAGLNHGIEPSSAAHAPSRSSTASSQRQEWCKQLGITLQRLETFVSKPMVPAAPAPVSSAPSTFMSLFRRAPMQASPIRTAHAPQLFATPEHLIGFMKACLRCKPTQLYLKYLMHEKVTEDVWRNYVAEIVAAADRVRSLSRPGKPIPQVVVFVDELNTAPTTVMSMIKEAMVDGTHGGLPLPTNIFWAGAVNPAIMRASSQAESLMSSDDAQAQFTVREMPLSLHQLVLDYDTMTPQQEADFLQTYLRDVGLGLSPSAQLNVSVEYFSIMLSTFVLESQALVRGFGIPRVHPSSKLCFLRVLALFVYI